MSVYILHVLGFPTICLGKPSRVWRHGQVSELHATARASRASSVQRLSLAVFFAKKKSQ